MAAMYDYDWAEADRRFRLAFAQGIPSHEVRITGNLYLAHAARGREAVAGHGTGSCRKIRCPGARAGRSAVAYRSVGRDAEADTRYAQLADIGP